MIIDFHTHTFPDKIAARTIEKLENCAHIKAFTDGTRDGLKASMEEAGVDLSIVLPVVTRPDQFESVNRFACKQNEQEEKLLSFGGIHPRTEHYREELREIKEMGLKGIKLHPDYQDVKIEEMCCKRIIDYATELGLIISVHAGVDIGLPDPVHCTPQGVKEVLKEVQPNKLVLAHYGGWKLWDEVEELLVGEDVFFDTAFTQGYISDEQFLRILANHGAEKILYATDSPWSGQRESIEYLSSLPIPKEQLDLIFYQNAQKLLGK